MSNLVMITSS